MLVGQRAIDVEGMSVALRLDGDDLPSLGERRQERSHHVDGHQATWDKDERASSAVDFVIHLETVDGSVTAPAMGATCLRVRCHDGLSFALIHLVVAGG